MTNAAVNQIVDSLRTTSDFTKGSLHLHGTMLLRLLYRIFQSASAVPTNTPDAQACPPKYSPQRGEDPVLRKIQIVKVNMSSVDVFFAEE